MMRAHLCVLTTKLKIYPSFNQFVHTLHLSDLSKGVQDAFLQQFTVVTKVIYTVWIRNQLDVTFVLSFISPLQVAQLFWATMCPSSGADNCIVLLPHVGIVLWLQEGCQNQLAGSVSIEEFLAQHNGHTTC